MSNGLSISQIYALSQGYQCIGNLECHWCGSPCTDQWTHDDPPPPTFKKITTSAKRPGNSYICAGCWLYRRKRITISYIDGNFKDGQCPLNHSWWIDNEAKAIKLDDPLNKKILYDKLLSPPIKFSLSFLTDPKCSNLLHLFELNHNKAVFAETQLKYTINNVVHSYSIYELEETLTSDDLNGKDPGAVALFRLLGPYPEVKTAKKIYDEKNPEKEGRGRPAPLLDGKVVRRIVS